MGKAKKILLEKEKDDKKVFEDKDIFGNILTSLNEASELYDVINKLMTADENLDLKTEVLRPRLLAVLDVHIDFNKNKQLKRTADILEKFRIKYLRYMISHNRASRMEMVEILKNRAKELEDKETAVEEI